MLRSLTLTAGILAGLPLVTLVGCRTAPQTRADRIDLRAMSQDTLNRAYAQDPSLRGFLDRSAGYAVFPDAGKAGLLVGGAYGKGVLYERGQVTGYCDLTQASVGAQAGAQKFAQIVAFENQDMLTRFKTGDFTLNATASAVALKSGVSENARYSDHVAIFTLAESGMMAEASVGGQRFRFVPISAQADVDLQERDLD
jgi:lipid-binding SYLF domain-containing protein